MTGNFRFWQGVGAGGLFPLIVIVAMVLSALKVYTEERS